MGNRITNISSYNPGRPNNRMNFERSQIIPKNCSYINNSAQSLAIS